MLSDGLKIPVGVCCVKLDEHLKVLGGASRLCVVVVFTKRPAAVAASLGARSEDSVYAHGVVALPARLCAGGANSMSGRGDVARAA